jgi:hypothetical protein
MRGGTFFGIYPMNRYARLQFSAGLVNYREQYNDPDLQFVSDEFQQENFGRNLFRDGTFAPLSVELIQETTVFREFGPLSGSTMSLGPSLAPRWAGCSATDRGSRRAAVNPPGTSSLQRCGRGPRAGATTTSVLRQ